jgi:hypothetical protein
MSINGISGTMDNQLYQVASQKTSGQSTRQTKAATQGVSEENKESACPVVS